MRIVLHDLTLNHKFNLCVCGIFLFLVPVVDFLVKIQDVQAQEREDAVFQCVLSHPMKIISWVGKNNPLEQGDKYDITVSEDMLIHTLVVKDCLLLDKGIYAAVAGIKSCNAWLVVEGMVFILLEFHHMWFLFEKMYLNAYANRTKC